MARLGVFLAVVFSLYHFTARAANADAWRRRSIYQLLTDRFALANDSGAPCDTSERKYCGGSYKGIENHIGYIKGMGFDAIWISPIVENIAGNTGYGYAYHGYYDHSYWAQDMNNLNTNFGSANDLKSLAQALHDNGMYLMIDVVIPANNTVANSTMTFDYGSFSPLNKQSDYHPQCWITDYSNQTNVEQCWLGDTTVALVDVNTEDPVVQSTLNTWIKDLVSEYEVDGIRIDTVKHVRKDFWPAFASSAGVFTIGEVFTDNVTYAAPYTEVVDAILDYPTWTALTEGFQSGSGKLSALKAVVTEAQSLYAHGEFLTGSFLENHDQLRFQARTTDAGLVRNAMTWSFIHDGIPILYSGQEQGYTGGSEPANREAIWLSGYGTDKALVKHITALNAVRKVAINSTHNYLSTPMKFVDQPNENVLAISKPPLLTLLTNAGSQGTASWNVSGVYKESQTLVDVLTCSTVMTRSDGSVSAVAQGGMPMVRSFKDVILSSWQLRIIHRY
ncbi:glycoside hydrolase family 13 protein [Fistulina hepatica ATCC 64428]|uniref:alpha-amylase n=1 Tax=Fistulina hepatica ATCC 64428 TaxID=1128425 RepID=A0A0D7ADP9_9AGAR|nr:glycoside hydrolase family 13 protein [Fistulina hepatica ATCC 64428]